MTTDELVARVIKMLDEGDDQFQFEMAKQVTRIETTQSGALFSVALNDETRDVRYVRHSWSGEHYRTEEVFPHTVVRTEYTTRK